MITQRIKTGIALVILAASTGCASFYAQMPNVEQRIEAWVHAHKYERALNTIDALDPEHDAHDNLADRVDEIREKRRNYISNIQEKAGSLMDRQQWGRAAALLDGAIENLPHAPALKAQREAIEKRRRESIRQSERKILLARGRYLLTIRTWEKKLMKDRAGGYSAKRRYRAYQQEVDETAEQLYKIGRRAYEKDNFSIALAAMRISNRLCPDSNEIGELLSQIRHKIQTELAEARSQKAAEAEKQWPMLKDGFRRAMADRDLAAARRIVSEMAGIHPEKAGKYNAKLEQHIEQEVRELIDRGQMLYGKGHIREAMQIWQAALKLKPEDPEIQKKIHRAETFLENMDRWGE
ncbi:MAG: hypothetical protein K9K62_06595 [Desulfobacteraceae bacterium]|nr:hypothetical protein [Desulfobacteraceae bacterium]